VIVSDNRQIPDTSDLVKGPAPRSCSACGRWRSVRFEADAPLVCLGCDQPETDCRCQKLAEAA
jgi:hypothetical protein